MMGRQRRSSGLSRGALMLAALCACAAHEAVEPVGHAAADSAAPAAEVASTPIALTHETLPAWRAYILPDADDLAYASIPWHVTFADGMEAARAEGKPLLMWAMNGHPLGCT